MFAPALTSVLLMPTFASTPTFGLTLTPELVEGALEPAVEPEAALGALVVLDDWLLEVPCGDVRGRVRVGVIALLFRWLNQLFLPPGMCHETHHIRG